MDSHPQRKVWVATLFFFLLLAVADSQKWHTNGTHPRFLVGIGVQKSGTTTLFKLLSTHPQIIRSNEKELRYFDFGPKDGGTMDAYLENWSRRLKENYKGSADNIGDKVLFEMSPDYLADKEAPAKAAKIIPQAKFVVIMREPVARARSALNMLRKRCMQQEQGQTIPSCCPLFTEWVDIANSTIRYLKENKNCSSGGDYSLCTVKKRSHMVKSLYGVQIERWFRFFNASQFLFLNYDELKKDQEGVLKQVSKFAGLKYEPSKPSDESEDRITSNVASFYYDEPRDDEANKLLIPFYEEHNEALYKLFNETGHDYFPRFESYEEDKKTEPERVNKLSIEEIPTPKAQKQCCKQKGREKKPKKDEPYTFCESVLHGGGAKEEDYAFRFGLFHPKPSNSSFMERALSVPFNLASPSSRPGWGWVFPLVVLAVVIVLGVRLVRSKKEVKKFSP